MPFLPQQARVRVDLEIALEVGLTLQKLPIEHAVKKTGLVEVLGRTRLRHRQGEVDLAVLIFGNCGAAVAISRNIDLFHNLRQSPDLGAADLVLERGHRHREHVIPLLLEIHDERQQWRRVAGVHHDRYRHRDFVVRGDIHHVLVLVARKQHDRPATGHLDRFHRGVRQDRLGTPVVTQENRDRAGHVGIESRERVGL